MTTQAAASTAPWIGLLLSGLAGRAMRVQALASDAATVAPSPTADARAILSDHHLLLPVWVTGGDDARGALDPCAIDFNTMARAATAHAAAHLRYSAAHQPTEGLKPMAVAVVSALEDARVERLAMAELPGLRRWWAPFHAETPSESDLTFGAFVARLGSVLFDPSLPDRNHWIDKGRTLFEQQAAIDLLDHMAFRRIGSVLANDLGQMRVRFEPQQYRVAPSYRDDNSFLWTHPERVDIPPPDEQALDPTLQLAALKLREAPSSIEGEPRPQPEEIELGRYLVPEWDHRSRRLRRDWCTVIETVPIARAAIAPIVMALLPPLPRIRAAQVNRARRLRRQLEGDDIDLDASIEVMVDRRLGLAPEARMFKRPGREAPHASLLVLLDLSESVNDPIGDQGSSLLALEQEAALRLAQAVHGAAFRVAVHGFNSDTRARVSYQRLLDFGEPFDEGAVGRIAAARARHSTRMGAALRHAADMLGGEPSARRNLLVVTDGAPSDIDVPDPRYLVEDARAAVQEARRRGVQVHCVTLDAGGERDARRIFGWQSYRVVTNPVALGVHLRQVQARAATR